MSDELTPSSDFFTDVRSILADARRAAYTAVNSFSDFPNRPSKIQNPKSTIPNLQSTLLPLPHRPPHRGRQVEIPKWFSVLPQFFRYGVSKVELMWVMSLGVPERSVADYLLQIFTQSHGREPRSLRDFLEWNIVQKEPILALVEQRWPRFFRDSYAAVLNRYESILQQLGEM